MIAFYHCFIGSYRLSDGSMGSLNVKMEEIKHLIVQYITIVG